MRFGAVQERRFHTVPKFLWLVEEITFTLVSNICKTLKRISSLGQGITQMSMKYLRIEIISKDG